MRKKDILIKLKEELEKPLTKVDKLLIEETISEVEELREALASVSESEARWMQSEQETFNRLSSENEKLVNALKKFLYLGEQLKEELPNTFEKGDFEDESYCD
jgi:hypothetical protein